MRWKIILILPAAFALGACEQTLETGYVPRPLNSTIDDRRAYYAPAFTPESHPPKEHGAAGFEGLR